MVLNRGGTCWCGKINAQNDTERSDHKGTGFLSKYKTSESGK